MDNIQYFDWGQIEWLYEPKENSNIMYVGLSTTFPGKSQPRHIHYGDEQLMYIIEGEGEQIINDVLYKIKPGMIFHIEPGSVHESHIYGIMPMKKLLISVPAYNKNDFIQKSEPSEKNNHISQTDGISLKEAIENLDDVIISKLKIPITIFDNEKIIYTSKYYPQICDDKCNMSVNANNCYAYNVKGVYNSPQYSGITAFICPYGLTVFILPIIYQDEVIGYIKAGHVKDHATILKDGEIIDKSVYDAPKSTVNRIMSIMNKLSNDIIEYFDFKKVRLELLKKEALINYIEKNKGNLEVSLSKLESSMLDIQINNHFLFNTLNAIANLALRDNSVETYTAIIELAKMFRYSVKKSGELISVKDEVEYLRNYINLQKLRYRDKLIVNYNVDLNLYDTLIPFNILQPIVENSFSHGFLNKKDNMKLKIEIAKINGKLDITLKDNGMGMDRITLINVINRLKYEDKLTKHGLIMIYTKLVTFYNDKFEFNIKSQKDEFTEINIKLPFDDLEMEV